MNRGARLGAPLRYLVFAQINKEISGFPVATPSNSDPHQPHRQQYNHIRFWGWNRDYTLPLDITILCMSCVISWWVKSIADQHSGLVIKGYFRVEVESGIFSSGIKMGF